MNLMTDLKASDESEPPPVLVIAKKLLARWRAVLKGAGIGLLAGILLVHCLPTKYRATMVVRPPDQGSGLGAMASLASSLTGGMLQGLSGSGDLFSGADQSNFDEFTTLLDSNELSEAIAERHPEVMHWIFRSSWDKQAQAWRRTPVIGAVKDFIKAVLGMQPWHPPDAERLRHYLAKHLDVSTDFKTGMVTISYSNIDRLFARDLLTVIHDTADSIVRSKERERALGRINYLQSTLPNVTQNDLRTVLIELMAQEQEKLMTVEGDKDFAAWVVDKPIAQHKPSFPPTLAILVVFVLLGGAIASVKILYFPKAQWFSSLRGWRSGVSGAVAKAKSRT